MPAYSKAAKRRAKKARGAPVRHVAGSGSKKRDTATSDAEIALSERPNEFRRARGYWAEPTGADKRRKPVVDLANDEIGKLHVAGAITDAQEQAARTYQRTKAAYLAELPEISGYKSCLDGSVPGYDDGDGDPRVIDAYRSLERAVRHIAGQRAWRQLVWTVDEGNAPTSLDELRAALNVIAEKV